MLCGVVLCCAVLCCDLMCRLLMCYVALCCVVSFVHSFIVSCTVFIVSCIVFCTVSCDFTLLLKRFLMTLRYIHLCSMRMPDRFEIWK